MNDLTIPQNSTASRPTWNALSARLKGLLLASRFSEIADSPALLSEAYAALPDLKRDATRPATAAEIMAILAPRFAIYPQPDRLDGEWDAWWAEYTNALDDIAPSAIEAGMAEYVKAKDSEFFPKPGRIRELAKTVPNRMAAAVLTAQRAITQAQDRDRPEPASTAPLVRADPATIAEMMAEFNKAMAEKAPAPKPVRPPVSGPVDGTGITQAMRERMERDRGC